MVVRRGERARLDIELQRRAQVREGLIEGRRALARQRRLEPREREDALVRRKVERDAVRVGQLSVESARRGKALDGEGLGAAWGKQMALEMLAAAGFTDVTVETVDGDVANNYYIARKG